MRPDLREGMQVTSSDGTRIGSVKEVRERDVVVIRPLGSTLYVPLDDIVDRRADRVVLGVSAAQVNRMGWERPRTERPAA